jgi:hypothetical protein
VERLGAIARRVGVLAASQSFMTTVCEGAELRQLTVHAFCSGLPSMDAPPPAPPSGAVPPPPGEDFHSSLAGRELESAKNSAELLVEHHARTGVSPTGPETLRDEARVMFGLS